MSLFVGNISKNIRSTELEEEFDKFGPCTVNAKVRNILFAPKFDHTYNIFLFIRAHSLLWNSKKKRTLKRPLPNFREKSLVDLSSLLSGAKRAASSILNLAPDLLRNIFFKLFTFKYRRRDEGVKCYNCNKTGHFARDCRSK
jgi:hypothetical protein